MNRKNVIIQLLFYSADCVVVSATAAEEVIYDISSVEPASLTSAFDIDPMTGTMMIWGISFIIA